MSVDVGSLGPWATETRRVEKPWGYELIWAVTDIYVGKVLFVKAGASLSLQYHEQKDESWLIQSGRARIQLGRIGPNHGVGPDDGLGDEALAEEEVGAGAAFHYTPGTVHRITAVEDTTILEVSTPHLEDVVRLEDSYGRAGTSAP
jgi:mannose-6-phosphate isomerase-like protein (cupin superfamily)